MVPLKVISPVFVFLLPCFFLTNGFKRENCQDGLIPETISASSVFDSKFGNFGPERSPLDTPEEVVDGVLQGGGWVAGVRDRNQWIKLALSDPAYITGVKTQDRDCNFCRMRVTRYRVSYSNDSVNWTCVKSPDNSERCQNFQGNRGTQTTVTNIFDDPFKAKYVRIEPNRWRQRIALRVGLLGCSSQEFSGCVSDCRDQSDGDYQSCFRCDVYISCVAGFKFDNRPCPAGLEWDDRLKRCEHKSTTCFL